MESESRITDADLGRVHAAVEARSGELVELLTSFVGVATENLPGTRLKEARSGSGASYRTMASPTRSVRPNPDEDYDTAKAEMLDLLDEMSKEHEITVEILQDARPAALRPITLSSHPSRTASPV